MLLYIIFFSNKSKNKSCSVYYKGTFCFSLCLPSLIYSLAAREKDLSEFKDLSTKIFFFTLIQLQFLHQEAFYITI